MPDTKPETVNILFYGAGGQGILTAATICSWAALHDGFQVKMSAIHGLARRGGIVEAHVRYGRCVFSPLIPAGRVDFLAGFNPKQTRKVRSQLRRNAVNLAEWIDPAMLRNRRQMNIILLGILSQQLSIREQSWIEAMGTVFHAGHREENLEAFMSVRKLLSSCDRDGE